MPRKGYKKRFGNQKPRIDIYNDGDIWLAEQTIELLDHYGIELLPWQRSVLYRWLAVVDDGEGGWKWANPDCGLSVPRQNGKTELLIARIIGGVVFLGEAIVYTAQSVNTVEEIKRRVLRFFYDAEQEINEMMTDEFKGEPRSLDYIELRNHGRCIFRTRTRTNGLGSSNDTLLNDEAQEYTDAQQEALLPTLAAGKNQNRQTIAVGTPPTAGTSGTVWVRTRTAVLEGKTANYCWQEWSVATITDPSDQEAWFEANPSLGYFLMLSAVRTESTTMATDSFNKMRLGWYAGVENMRAISDDQWNPLAVTEVNLPANPNIAYAVKFAPDGSAVSLAVAVIMPDTRVHVESIERRPMNAGINWIAAWLLERWRKCNKIIIDGAAGTQLLVEELVRSERKISKRILTPNAREAGAAYAGFYNAIDNQTLTHFNQPALNLSIRTVKKRPIGRDGAFGYAAMNSDIQSDPTEAVAWAHYAAVRFKKERPAGGTGQSVMI
jgi:phage terminase large subunit-like protein